MSTSYNVSFYSIITISSFIGVSSIDAEPGFALFFLLVSSDYSRLELRDGFKKYACCSGRSSF
jgi:hypothetical protein